MSTLGKLRDIEAARIARWFRETEYGLVFYDRRGRAWPISDGERRLWQSQAMRQLDRFVAQYRRVAFETVLIAIVLMTAFGFAAGWLGGPVPMLHRIPAPAAAVPALLWPYIVAWRFRRGQRRLRGGIAERLTVRTPLPGAAAAAHRRFNIFAAAQAALVSAIIVLGAAAAFRSGPESIPLHLLTLVALAWPLHWAARKVDAVHRRKPG
jgi:hypothetical protein